jgi:hypothetical protein
MYIFHIRSSSAASVQNSIIWVFIKKAAESLHEATATRVVQRFNNKNVVYDALENRNASSSSSSSSSHACCVLTQVQLPCAASTCGRRGQLDHLRWELQFFSVRILYFFDLEINAVALRIVQVWIWLTRLISTTQAAESIDLLFSKLSPMMRLCEGNSKIESSDGSDTSYKWWPTNSLHQMN